MKKIKTNEDGFGLIETLLIILILLVIAFGGYFVYHAQKTSSSGAGTSTKSSSSSDAQSGREQLNTKGTRRPPQYLHICTTDNDITYVSQGNPRCLGKDSYEGDYDSSVPGLLYSSPCKTTSGAERYVYISENESCPEGTELVFYNNVCPTDAISSDQCTVPSSSSAAH